MAYNKKKHLADNIAALRIAFTKSPDDIVFSDRKVLKLFSGFGGLNCILSPAATDDDIEQ
jgi:hypothetical protein